jgi:hypothetical protein
MKKTFLVLAACSFIIMSGCNTPAQKLENAQNKVDAANQDLNEANQEYLADVEKYRKETADKIAANERSINEFNARVESDKQEAKEDYKKKIMALEQKNSDMKKKMDDYKMEGKEGWEKFKTEFNHDMDEVGQAFKDLTVKNVK